MLYALIKFFRLSIFLSFSVSGLVAKRPQPVIKVITMERHSGE